VRAGTRVREGEPSAEHTEAFIAAMHRNASNRAPAVAEALDLTSRRRLLDVGGGSGAYSIAFARANRNLHCVVFDLGPVTQIARRHIEQAKLSDRVTVQVGDLHRDDFGSGYDLVFVSAILHMLSPEENVALLRKCHGALLPRGEVVIQDFVMNDDKTAPRAGALFALNMLVATRGGSSYSEAEYRSWLAQAGFSVARSVPFPGTPTGLVMELKR
jgi:cyclopropane fatty-acyl-phospholipid synthase-like methyltransferase